MCITAADVGALEMVCMHDGDAARVSYTFLIKTAKDP